MNETEANTAEPIPITPADIAASDRLAGRETSEAERELMVKQLTEAREKMLAVRTSELAEGMMPAAHFDPRLPGMALPTGKSKVTVSRGAMPRYDGSNLDSLAFLTVVELSRLIRARKVTSLGLTRMYLDRLKRFGPRLLCVVNLTEERALRQAAQADAEIAAGRWRGPLHGIPWGAKDLLATRGYPTTCGIQPYADRIIDEDATVVSRLDAAGAVLVAKLSMGELAMGDVWYGGTTRNPWDSAGGASGSSAGPGSATAAGLVGFSIGTETLGSIVSPCVMNGVAGLRPTYGRVSRQGAMALSWTMDKIGPMCRGVEDCALVFDAIRGPDGLDPTVVDAPFRWDPKFDVRTLRVGVNQASFDEAAKDERRGQAFGAACLGVLDTLRSLGVALTPIALPEKNPAYSAIAGLTIRVEGAAAFARLNADGGLRELVQQDDWNWPNAFRAGATVPASDYLQSLRVRSHLQRAMADALKDVDVYVSVPWFGSSLLYTNLTGHPEVIARCGRQSNGAPIMVSFIGGLYQDDAALQLAFAYERATAWHREWPDVELLPETPPALVRDKPS